MSLEMAYRELESGSWALVNALDCPCRGFGWMHSDLDTYHTCPIHTYRASHPEDEESDPAQDRAAQVANYRVSYRHLAQQADLSLAELTALVKQVVGPDEVAPAQLLQAAQQVVDEIESRNCEWGG